MECHPERAEECPRHFVEVQGAQEAQGDPWVEWEAEEETEAASPLEALEAPEGTHQEEGMSNTELETGSAPIRGVGTRTLPGEQNATSVKPQSLKVFSHHPFRPRVVTGAEVALVACGEEEVASWTAVVLEECSEVVVEETEVASVVAGAWTEVALVEADEVALGDPLGL